MSADTAVLAVDDVVVNRGGKRILDGISLRIAPSSRVLIRGRSGAGKTTLFQLLGLLATPDSGRISVNGQPVSELTERRRSRIRREETGLVFQDFQLIPDLTARENAALPMEHGGGDVDDEWLDELFGTLQIAEQSSQYPASLSGGEKQRVGIARALANRPSIVIADEPTGQLDPQTSETVINFLHSIHEETSTSLVVISHDTSLGTRFDQIIHLADGEIVEM